MYRKIEKYLEKWKNSISDRLPLVVYGARQVGKTFVIRKFAAANYRNSVYVNFESDNRIIPMFDDDIRPESVIKILERYYKVKIEKGRTCIILDEIQLCPRALTALKYFSDKEPDYHIISIGNMMGSVIKSGALPASKVRLYNMQPMNFYEFMIASGEDILIDKISMCFVENEPMPDVWHYKIMSLFREFLATGGMPAVVQRYIDGEDSAYVERAKADIINSYIADMMNYAGYPLNTRAKAAFDSLPVQLSKENRKFQYKFIKEGARASHYRVAAEWLTDAGITFQCIKIKHAAMPVGTQREPANYRLYFNDTGLFAAKANIDMWDLTRDGYGNFNDGLVENYVAAQLAAEGYELLYWESDGRAGVEFVIQTEGGLIPVEVQAHGKQRSRSLSVFKERYSPEVCYRVSDRNFGIENGIRSIPLYAVFMI